MTFVLNSTLYLLFGTPFGIVSPHFLFYHFSLSIGGHFNAVRDRLFDALSSPHVSNEDFERSISLQHLYPICRVARQAKPRGHPRKAKDGDGT